VAPIHTRRDVLIDDAAASRMPQPTEPE